MAELARFEINPYIFYSDIHEGHTMWAKGIMSHMTLTPSEYDPVTMLIIRVITGPEKYQIVVALRDRVSL